MHCPWKDEWTERYRAACAAMGVPGVDLARFRTSYCWHRPDGSTTCWPLATVRGAVERLERQAVDAAGKAR